MLNTDRAMREVELRLTNRKLAAAMAELRQWLDHHQCIPENFDIVRRGRSLVIHITFTEDDIAEAFQREFTG